MCGYEWVLERHERTWEDRKALPKKSLHATPRLAKGLY